MGTRDNCLEDAFNLAKDISQHIGTFGFFPSHVGQALFTAVPPRVEPVRPRALQPHPLQRAVGGNRGSFSLLPTGEDAPERS